MIVGFPSGKVNISFGRFGFLLVASHSHSHPLTFSTLLDPSFDCCLWKSIFSSTGISYLTQSLVFLPSGRLVSLSFVRWLCHCERRFCFQVNEMLCTFHLEVFDCCFSLFAYRSLCLFHKVVAAAATKTTIMCRFLLSSFVGFFFLILTSFLWPAAFSSWLLLLCWSYWSSPSS